MSGHHRKYFGTSERVDRLRAGVDAQRVDLRTAWYAWRAELKAWLLAHPSAWAGWPASTAITEESDARALEARLARAGAPAAPPRPYSGYSVARDASAVVAEIRIERQRAYRAAVKEQIGSVAPEADAAP